MLKTPAAYKTLEEAVEIARELAPRLAQRVGQADTLRRLPDENVADLLDSGLIDLETPRMWGGAELNLDALLEVTYALAEGCSSTGWVYALWAAHVWLVAQFPKHVQEEVLTNPRSLVSSIVNTTGQGKLVDGGYLWSGKGIFSSGSDHCNWITARIEAQLEKDETPERYWFLIPRSDFEIIDDWHVVGLRGTGSKTLLLKDVFVPFDRILRTGDLNEGKGIAVTLHESPMWSAAMDFTFSLPLAGPVQGVVGGMLRMFEERCRERASLNETPALLRLSKAAAQIDAGRALLLENARRFCTVPAPQTTIEQRTKCFRDVAYSTQVCREVANSIFEASGSASVYDVVDISRRWRDANVASAHHAGNWDIHGVNYGRAAMGLPVIPGVTLPPK